MNKKERLEKLYAFKSLDKYATFGKAQSGIIHAHEDQQQIISELLDNCCKELAIEIESVKKPTKTILRSIVIKYMDAISIAKVNTENRDFGIHLCYFLAEKAGIDIRRQSETKIWGYWTIDNNNLRVVTRKRRTKK